MKYYTCSQNAIPSTVREAVEWMDRGTYPTVDRYDTFEEAKKHIHQTGRHNVLLEDVGGELKIILALWDSQ